MGWDEEITVKFVSYNKLLNIDATFGFANLLVYIILSVSNIVMKFYEFKLTNVFQNRR